MTTQTPDPDPIDPYHFDVIWSEDDREYVGICREFLSLSHLAPNEAEALAGIKDVVRSVLEEMQRTGGTPPEPIP